ncbi:MAG: PD40 domain-containing protein [Chloroflexi bacterium]|nr:PD40 domain-containing protein [Chloroflexota bacterium]
MTLMILTRSFLIIGSIAILLTSGLLLWARAQPSEAHLVAHSDFWDGSSDIHLRIPSTHYDANLTHHPAHDTQPTWSPDGKWIAFVSDRETTRKGGHAINALYIMRPNGSDLHKVGLSSPATGTRVVSWSADSQWLYSRYVTRGWWDSYMVRVQDGYSETLWFDTTFTLYAAWSPEADRIAYRTGMDEDTVSSIGQASPSGAGGIVNTQILFNSEDVIDYLVWSADGRQIAFITHTRDANAQYALYVLAMGDNQARLLYASPRPFLDLTWTGSSISFLNTDNQAVSLYNIWPTSVTPNKPIFSLAGQYGRIAWSASQQSLIFVNYDNHQNTVYRLKLDGSDVKFLYQSSTSIQRVNWSPDGKWVLIGMGYREQTQLYQMRPDGSEMTYLTDVAFDWDIPLSPAINKAWQGSLLAGIGVLMGSLAIVSQTGYRFSRARKLD